MSPLLTYLNSLPPPDQVAYATRCRTTVGYLRKAISTGQKISAETCIHLERESDGAVVCEALRPDVDWVYIRGTAVPRAAAANVDSASPNQTELFANGDGEGAASHDATLTAAAPAVHHHAGVGR